MKNKNWLVAATLLAGLAVIFGAFGAHGLKVLVAPQQIETFKTGVQYHFYHSLAIAISVLISQFIDNAYIKRSFRLFSLGIFCFSGSLYMFTFAEVLSITIKPLIGLITPVGGIFFILGWLNLSFGIYREKQI